MVLSQTSPKSRRGVIHDWRPDDKNFWQFKGKRIARKNLIISICCLLLSFAVWMLFSSVAVNLHKVGFNFTTDQLFLLTALPSVSGALLRVPYSFVIPIWGGRRWTAFSTALLMIPCIWLGLAVQDSTTPFSTFVIIALLCGFGGANFASSMANISFFYPKDKQGGALGLNGGLGNIGVSVMQLLVPLIISIGIFNIFGSSADIQSNNDTVWLKNAAWFWIPFLFVCTFMAWFGMNDIATAKASVRQQLSVLKEGHLWVLSLLYLATFGSFIGFSAGFTMLTNTQFPESDILHVAFLGPLIGALMRPIGGALSDKWGGIKVTMVNFMLMGLFATLLFFTLPTANSTGHFNIFFIIFMALFATAGLGSGSTFQMISVVFRHLIITKVKKRGESEIQAQIKAATDTAAALGFISAIGAIGGFFIPKAFGTSLALTGSPVDAMKVFIFCYIACLFITWLIYGRNIQTMATKKKVSTA
ncbi:NarK family nitrate/nitrite MFS transporter [Shewanella algae]|uniref:NarK family nitrate/nitrite MFS transporter n=1 Tax=Shewanella algae TaxID=38313 RepID=UPI000F42B198|nr:NarK family nitrate/nitrite MFS transporter [Shewanella algae]AYV14501.1 NarK family nitrate/nitrite MFS transporter [Shewanella algae]